MSKTISFLLLFCLSFILSCTSSPKHIPTPKSYYFVTESYEKRNEGYDWMAVFIEQKPDSNWFISIKSRSDTKKPTCSFFNWATQLNDTTFESMILGKSVLFHLKDKELEISVTSPNDASILYYFCSGGASLQEHFIQVETIEDENQLDPSTFKAFLNLQSIQFEVSSTKKDSIQELTIQPFGLSISNDAYHFDINGYVVSAEIEDLNSDGFPEVIVFTRSADENQSMTIFGTSVNNGKSLSTFYAPPISEQDKSVQQGYAGFDEYAVVETSIIQRFPLFENGIRTGKMRQLRYQLIDGEATRQLKLISVNEY